MAAKTVSDLVEQVFIPNKDTIGLEELLINLLDGLGFLTLVFDEANLAFSGDVKNWDQAKSDLEILVAMSKQNHQATLPSFLPTISLMFLISGQCVACIKRAFLPVRHAEGDEIQPAELGAHRLLWRSSSQ